MQDKKVIVHLTGNLLVGGAEKQLSLFCRSLDHERFSQYVLCMRGGGPLEEQLNEAGIPIIKLRKNAKIDIFFFVRLILLCHENVVDHDFYQFLHILYNKMHVDF